MKIDWRRLGEGFAVVSVVLSLLFVAYELRLSRSVALNESFAINAALTADVQTLITENSDIWNRGCVGEELDEEEYVTFVSIVRTIDSISFARWQRALVGFNGANPDWWTASIALNMHRYEGFRDAWRNHQKAKPWSSSLFEINDGWGPSIERQYEYLQENGESERFERTICGTIS